MRENPGFSVLWAINFASSMVGWSMGIVLSVHIYRLTGSALWTAVFAATPALAGLVFGHVAGTVADRWNPLRVVQLTLASRVVVLLGLFVVAEAPFKLALLVFLQAVIQQIYRPAEQVLIADLVSADNLPQANGLNSFASNATRLVAPALGGFIMVLVGFSGTALGLTVFMTCSAILSLTLGRWYRPKPPRDDNEGSDGTAPSGMQPVGTYLKLLRRNPRVRGLVLLQILDAVKEGPLTALFPVLMLGVVGATASEMGLASSAFAVSAVLAGPLMGTVIKRAGYHLPVIAGAAVAQSLIVVLVIWPSFPMALIVFFLSGLPFTVSWVGSQTWLLLTAPLAMRGRVIGTSGAIYSGVLLTTMLGSGALADIVGVQWVIGAAAAVAVLGLIPVHLLLRSGVSSMDAGAVPQTQN
ncbi:MFS transporter [Arthrobacter sp. zg-Y1219]|nr:MFS transporter [Arthrobacter sp. zg-Y1219]